MRVQKLASGPGWSVSDIVCLSGPHDRPFEEQQTSVCIAAVMQGSFQYRTSQGAATLVPGALLLGNQRSCFECGHDHSTGDRCLSFMFDPAYFESILSSIPGVRTDRFPGSAPASVDVPDARFRRCGVRSEQRTIRCGSNNAALEIAAEASRLAAKRPVTTQPNPSRPAAGRSVLRRIEIDPGEQVSIGELARGPR